MSKEDIIRTIRRMIYNPRPTLQEVENDHFYTGFDMCGGRDSILGELNNFKIISDLERLVISQTNNSSNYRMVFPVFHKGVGVLVEMKTNGPELKVLREDLGGWTTEAILLEIVKIRAPELLE